MRRTEGSLTFVSSTAVDGIWASVAFEVCTPPHDPLAHWETAKAIGPDARGFSSSWGGQEETFDSMQDQRDFRMFRTHTSVADAPAKDNCRTTPHSQPTVALVEFALPCKFSEDEQTASLAKTTLPLKHAVPRATSNTCRWGICTSRGQFDF